MAIDLFCYTSCDKDELKKIVDEMSVKNREVFTEKFRISKIREVNMVNEEIALEQGLNAKTFFNWC